MRLKETSKGVFIVHKAEENLTCKKVYDICKAKVSALKNDESIKHIRYVYEKFKRQVERYEKEVELYEWLMRRLENEGKTDDNSSIFGNDE